MMADWLNDLKPTRWLKRFSKPEGGGPAPPDAFFRANVGALVFDRDGRVLVLRRRDVATPTWQLPQGGLQMGEAPLAALQRELSEETGLEPDDYTITAEYPRWLAYELPEAFQSPRLGKGQVQKWFVCRLVDDLSIVRPDQVEFDAFKWVTLDEMVVHAVDFRRSIYEQLASFAADIIKHSILIYR
jgi:putative (di)nucleoside polyphosphate hydrolase